MPAGRASFHIGRAGVEARPYAFYETR